MDQDISYKDYPIAIKKAMILGIGHVLPIELIDSNAQMITKYLMDKNPSLITYQDTFDLAMDFIAYRNNLLSMKSKI